MTIKDLINKLNYKRVFNHIYRCYLKEYETDKIIDLDNKLYSAWQSLQKVNSKKSDDEEVESSSIFLKEVKDESGLDDCIDTCLYNGDVDEFYALDFLPWENLIEKKIHTELKLTKEQIMAHILWEITFWGFTAEKVKEAGDKLLDERDSNSFD
jgi:hypothetical protein|tara:strand:+ start:1068 stop:1529 length:462 start_codon:yes stop_codon:yes gene_type:complete